MTGIEEESDLEIEDEKAVVQQSPGSKTDAVLRREVRGILRDLEAARMRMARLKSALPRPDVDPEDADDAGDVSLVRSTIECLLTDRIDPALEDLGGFLGLMEGEEPDPGAVWVVTIRRARPGGEER